MLGLVGPRGLAADPRIKNPFPQNRKNRLNKDLHGDESPLTARLTARLQDDYPLLTELVQLWGKLPTAARRAIAELARAYIQ